MNVRKLKIIPLIIFIALIGFLWRGLFLNPKELPSVQIGKSLPSFHLPKLGAADEQLLSNTLQGKWSLLNIWASWCESCKQEQAFLLQLAEGGLPIYGINYKDSPEDAQHWLDQWGDPYRAVGIDPQGNAIIDLGVYGTPETFLIDPNGVIRYRHAGILDEAIWKEKFLPVMQKDLS